MPRQPRRSRCTHTLAPAAPHRPPTPTPPARTCCITNIAAGSSWESTLLGNLNQAASALVLMWSRIHPLLLLAGGAATFLVVGMASH